MNTRSTHYMFPAVYHSSVNTSSIAETSSINAEHSQHVACRPVVSTLHRCPYTATEHKLRWCGGDERDFLLVHRRVGPPYHAGPARIPLPIDLATVVAGMVFKKLRNTRLSCGVSPLYRRSQSLFHRSVTKQQTCIRNAHAGMAHSGMQKTTCLLLRQCTEAPANTLST